MRVGDMRHRVTLEKKEQAPDGGGGYSEQWEPVATVWASVRPLTVREQLLAGQLQARITHKVRMRYRPGVTADLRLRLRGRILAVVGVADIEERHIELELTCEEVGQDV